MKATSEEIYGKSTQRTQCITFSGLQRCRLRYGPIFIRLAVVSQICEISLNSRKIRTYTVQGHQSWCQSKVYMQLPISH